MPPSEHDVATAHSNSWQLWLSTQDLDKIKPIQTAAQMGKEPLRHQP